MAAPLPRAQRRRRELPSRAARQAAGRCRRGAPRGGPAGGSTRRVPDWAGRHVGTGQGPAGGSTPRRRRTGCRAGGCAPRRPGPCEGWADRPPSCPEGAPGPAGGIRPAAFRGGWAARARWHWVIFQGGQSGHQSIFQYSAGECFFLHAAHTCRTSSARLSRSFAEK